MWEQMYGGELGTNRALVALLAVSNGRGGGDLETGHNVRPEHGLTEEEAIALAEAVVGRWGGDRIAIIGDYTEQGDLAPEDQAQIIYSLCKDAEGAQRAADHWRKYGSTLTDPERKAELYRDADRLEFELAEFGPYTDISDAVVAYLCFALDVKMEGDGSGWRDFVEMGVTV